jgi:uncharacterized membrane protein YjfL (UPF0719 family)
MTNFLINCGYILGYGIAAALVMAVALSILIKLWNWVTPVDEWEEVRKGNICIAIILAAIIIAFGMVVSTAISPGH